MVRERLTPSELREINKGEHLLIDLHEDCYWEQAEGTVTFVKEYVGSVHVGLKGLRGHSCRLKIPNDARAGMKFTGAAQGANNLRVDTVYRL